MWQHEIIGKMKPRMMKKTFTKWECTRTYQEINKEGQFLKKLWCCISGSYKLVLSTELFMLIGHHREFSIVQLHLLLFKTQTTHSSSICSDKGLMLGLSALETLFTGQFTSSSQLITLTELVLKKWKEISNIRFVWAARVT